jgi:hypothetical protein
MADGTYELTTNYENAVAQLEAVSSVVMQAHGGDEGTD